MKRFVIYAATIFFVAVLCLPLLVNAAELKIGYANLQRALNECEAGKSAKEALKKEAKGREEELNRKERELKALKEEIEKKRAVWNAETRAKKEKELRIKSKEFQKQYMAYGEELNKKKRETEGRIIDELRKIVNEVAEREGYTYIFEISLGGVLYGPPDDDITDEVIKLYNERFREQQKKQK